MEALEEAWDRAKREPALLRNEWESMLDKMNATTSRLNARIRTADRVASSESEEPEAPATPPLREARSGNHDSLVEMRRRRRI